MKRFLLTIALLMCMAIAIAQEANETRAYCELLGTSKMFSNKVKVTVDFGQATSFWKGNKDQQLVDENGKDIQFNSMIDAMNYMGRYGWKFIQAYAIGDARSGYVYHWLLYKDVKDEMEVFDGFMTKEQYKESLGQ